MTIQTQAELRARPRTIKGKKVRFLRRRGVTPANIYGHNIPSTAIELDTDPLVRTLRHTPRTALMSLYIAGEQAARPVLIRLIQRNPIDDSILHIDFYQVSLREKMRTEVPVHLTGTSPAVEDLGGVLVQELNTVQVECLPTDLPQVIEADINGLCTFEDSLHVRDLTVPPGVTILTDPDVVVATVTPSAVRAELEAEAAKEEAAQAEAAQETGEAQREE